MDNVILSQRNLDAADISYDLETWIEVGRNLSSSPNVVDRRQFAAVFSHMTNLISKLRIALEP